MNGLTREDFPALHAAWDRYLISGVNDEVIVQLGRCRQHLGAQVPGKVSTGQSAIRPPQDANEDVPQ